jgi:hypothetical protein
LFKGTRNTQHANETTTRTIGTIMTKRKINGKPYKAFFTRNHCNRLAAGCMDCDSLDECADVVDQFVSECRAEQIARNDFSAGKGWISNLEKLARSFRAGKPGYTVFAKGNSKLPFYSYSELPNFTCPGAGECLNFCYSFTAWRYPAAFARQVSNTMFMRFKRGMIAKAFRAIKPVKGQDRVVVRLYVDGDFADVSVFSFWMGQLHRSDCVDAYGYSKSWEVIKEFVDAGFKLPINYVLNLSSGSRYDDNADLKGELGSYDITRGEFLAVQTDGDYAKGFARFDDPAYHNAVRAAGRDQTGCPKVFSCTGKCGDCLPNGQHACGLVTLTVPIVIAEHN